MESVAAYAGVPPMFGERETLCDLRELMVESRVEAGDVGNVGEAPSGGSDERETRPLMQWRQRDEGTEFGEQLIIDDGRGVAAGTSMHDAVTDRRGWTAACGREASQDVIELGFKVAAL